MKTILKKETKKALEEVLGFITEMSEDEVKDLKIFLQGARYAKEESQKAERKYRVIKVKKVRKGA